MKINYDKVADAMYIQVKKGKIHQTVEVSDFVIHDLDAKGKIIGIELLNASEQFSPKDLKKRASAGIPFSFTSAIPVTA